MTSHANCLPKAPVPNSSTERVRVSTRVQGGAVGGGGVRGGRGWVHIQSVTGKFLLSQVEFGDHSTTHPLPVNILP